MDDNVPPAAVPAPEIVERPTVPVSALFTDAERAAEVTPSTPAEVPVKSTQEVRVTPLPPNPIPPAAVPSPEKPATPPAPAVPDPDKPVTPPAPAAPAPEQKFKIGGKEYTQKELEAELAKRSSQTPPTPAPAPTAAPVPAPVPAAPPPTPEQIAKLESDWQAKFINEEQVNAFPVTEKEMETILAGDAAGIKLLQDKFNQVLARSVLLARKSIYTELASDRAANVIPALAQIQQSLQPIFSNAQQVEMAAAEIAFFTAYPDFKGHAETVKGVGAALLQQYPKECQAMTPEQLMAEVAAQADRILTADCNRFAPGQNWRTVGKAPAPVIPAPAPVAPAVVPAPVVPPPVKAPGSNAPAGIKGAASAPQQSSFHKQVAASLVD